METLKQVLPVDIVQAMINSDITALTESEISELKEYESELLQQGYIAIPLIPDSLESDIYTSNDLNNICNECLEVEFQRQTIH